MVMAPDFHGLREAHGLRSTRGYSPAPIRGDRLSPTGCSLLVTRYWLLWLRPKAALSALRFEPFRLADEDPVVMARNDAIGNLDQFRNGLHCLGRVAVLLVGLAVCEVFLVDDRIAGHDDGSLIVEHQ